MDLPKSSPNVKSSGNARNITWWTAKAVVSSSSHGWQDSTLVRWLTVYTVLAQRMAEILASLKKAKPIIPPSSNDAHVADVIDRIYVIERGSIVEN